MKAHYYTCGTYLRANIPLIKSWSVRSAPEAFVTVNTTDTAILKYLTDLMCVMIDKNRERVIYYDVPHLKFVFTKTR
jgi:hypothetical protein